MNGWPTSFVQVLMFINVLFVTCLIVLNEKLWKCIIALWMTIYKKFLQEV